MNVSSQYPSKIVCLTEESVETLYLIGKQDLIKGVSAFVKRPVEAQKLPKVSFFTSSNYKKIIEIKPDLILGHSDIQKDIARDLIELGQSVFIANHRSIEGILQYIQMLSNLVDGKEEGQKLVQQCQTKIARAKELTKNLHRKPRIYFEEWDKPLISGIQWVSELIELCGGVNVFKHNSNKLLAKDRFIEHADIITANPDIIFACWCGKKVDIKSIKARASYEQINAIKNNRVYELAPEIFLQPGPAPLIAGLDILINYIQEFNDGVCNEST
ncbi:MAG: ABC transporter substrate-binding protein [Halobacteriovoraceae bacterium]|jgi:iron complex transport system substrate-binding protein|nr:ABC transporter substrate-binding protein [Halobacteriovoraceae bacterium]